MGSPQVISCTVSTVSGVELESSSVMISWSSPGGRAITNSGRRTISPTTSSGNNYTSTLQITFLREGTRDVGNFRCSWMILGTIVSRDIEVQSLSGKFSFT